MANHTCISLSQPLTVLDVETVVQEVNRRRFKGRFHVPREPELTKMNDARQAWTFQAPGTKPEDPGPFNPDENLGFCFWLNKGGQSIEVRHNPFNAWISWVRNVFDHELAKGLRVSRFDSGDGMVKTDPAQFKDTAKAYYMRDFIEPLSEKDRDFIQWAILRHIPEGWE